MTVDSTVELCGLHLDPDHSARRSGDGTVLIGGSPLRLLRFSPAGAALVDRLWTGEPIPAGSGATALARRLLDAGLAHPDWTRTVTPTPPFTERDVTVVVPVRGALPPELLASVGPVAGVVVVDDASPRAVTAVAATPDGAPVTVVRHDHRRGPGGARTTGLGLVATPLVAFLDADCAPRPGWLDRLLPHFGDPTVAAVAPRITSAEPGTSGLSRYEAGGSALDMGPTPARVRARSRVGHVPTAAMLARVDALGDVGGFDPALQVGEDVDLVWRLDDAGWTVRYEPAATVAHHHRTGLWSWARRRCDYGSAAGPLARRHPATLAPVELPALRSADAVTRLRRAGADPALAAEIVDEGRTAAMHQLARALVRPWWPVTLAMLLVVPSRRLRPVVGSVVAGIVVTAALRDRARNHRDVAPMTFVACRLADDVAYGTGVWLGCLRERTLEPVLPVWPAARTSTNRG